MNLTFNYIAITNNPIHASIIDEVGIPQIMVDAEKIGKIERQGGKNTVINNHKISDIGVIKESVKRAKLICRINPYHDFTFNEVQDAIKFGSDAIMIPMISKLEHLYKIIDFTCGKIDIIPLVETPYSLFKIKDILDTKVFAQVHFGLNDLFLALGMRNLFEILLSPVFESAVKYASLNCKLVGFGGVGNPLEKQAVSPLLILNEHMKYGSKSVILSRNFFSNGYNKEQIQSALALFESLLLSGYSESNSEKLRNEISQF